MPAPFLLDAMAGDTAVWHMPRGDPPTVYLTYDDGPNPTTTPDLLDVLGREGAPATFFQERPKLVLDEPGQPIAVPKPRGLNAERLEVVPHDRVQRRWSDGDRPRISVPAADVGWRIRNGRLVLVLDEPSAALNAKTEHTLVDRYTEVVRGRSEDGRVTITVSGPRDRSRGDHARP